MWTKKFNIESLVNDSTRELYETRLRQYIADNKVEKNDSVNKGYIKIRNNIYGITKEVLGYCQVNKKSRDFNKPWFSEEVKAITRKKKEVHLKFLNIRTAEDEKSYHRKRNKAKACEA